MLLCGLIFGGLAALTNYFLSVPYYGYFSLYFGQIFVFLCLVTRGLNASIIAAIVSAAALALKQNEPFLFLILVSEIFAVYMFLRNGKVLLLADVFYWLVIGIPLTLLLLYLKSTASSDLLVISGLTLGINGIFCASVAALAYSFLPISTVYKKYRSKPPKFASVIFSLCMLTITIPTIAISAVFTWQNTQQKEQDIANSLARQGGQVKYFTEAFVNQHLAAVNTLSKTISNASFSLPVQTILDATSDSYPYFLSMLVSDAQGDIDYASPKKYAKMLSRIKEHTLHERAYFKSAKNTLQPQISSAIKGTGFGNDAILAVSAPIVSGGEFIGISQGAIKLSSFSKFKDEHIDDSTFYQYVITDINQTIIYASKGLDLQTLSKFTFQPSDNPFIDGVPELALQNKKYLYHQATTMHDWTITVLSPPQTVTSIITKNFYLLSGGLLFTLLVLFYIANQLSKRVTQPLVHLAEHFNDISMQEDIAKQAEISDEIMKVAEKLISSRDVMLNFQQQLKEQVEDKTKQLKTINKQLYSLAQHDGLTNLLNRSGFDELAQTAFRNCVRNKIPLSMVLIDIDDFKLINDTFGHPFGDQCIVSIADSLKQFYKRDTDLIGRYGGEEFIIFLSGGNIEEHHEITKKVHARVQQTQLTSEATRVDMTISVGISSLSSKFTMTYEGLIKSADEQLYKSKRTGKNKISIYTQ